MANEVLERSLAIWSEDLPESTKSLASLLSVAISLEHGEILRVANDLWPGRGEDELRSDIRLIEQSPFIAQGVRGLAMREDVSAVVAEQFRASDRLKFDRAHVMLASIEEARLASRQQQSLPASVGDDSWEIRARLAFYLAATEASKAEDQFGRSFATVEADTGESRIPRTWLAKLGIRQSYLLGADSRTVAFMKAFLTYTQDSRHRAQELFEGVLEGAGVDRVADVYDAVAGHLWAVGEPYTSDHATSRLRTSIDLSEQLGLTTNCIMARNSLVYRLLSNDEILEAAALANVNLNEARAVGDAHLLSWCLHTAGAARLEASGFEQAASGEIEGVVELASEAVDLARDLGDVETETQAMNTLAQALIGLGRSDEAVSRVGDFAEGAERFERPRSAKRLLQTLGTLRRSVDGSSLGEIQDGSRLGEIQSVMDRLNGW